MAITLNKEQADTLKKTYATAEDLQASESFKSMTSPAAQQIALSAYATPAPAPTFTPQRDVMLENPNPTALNQQMTDFSNKQWAITNVKWEKTPAKKEWQPELLSPEQYQDVSDKRLADIQTNLTRYSAEQPALFNNVNTYRNFFNYEGRAPEQKAALDSFFATEKDKRDTYNTLSSMSEMDLMNITDTNKLSVINADPNLKKKYDAAMKNKQMLEFVYGKDYWKTEVPTIDGIDNLPDNIQTEIFNANTALQTTKNEMDKIQDTMDSTYDDLVKQYEWTWETDSYIRAKANKENAELTNQYNDLTRKYNSQLWTVTGLKDMVTAKKEEDALKREERATNLAMYNSLYGDYSDRNPKKEDVKIQTKDFGTTKNPDRRQSLDGGKTRQKIDWLGGWTWGSGTWTWWAGWTASQTAVWLKRALDLIRYAAINEPLKLRLQMTTWGGNYAAALDYIKNNLSLVSFKDAKASWVSFGAMTQWERDMLKKSSIAVNALASIEWEWGILSEVNRLQWAPVDYRWDPNYNPKITTLWATAPQVNTTIAAIQKKRWITTATPAPVTTATNKTTTQKAKSYFTNLAKNILNKTLPL